MVAPAPLRIGYLISQYPAINHTFILREILELRKSGFDIQAISVRPPDRQRSGMTGDEAAEAERCPVILARSRAGIVFRVLAELFRRPGGFFRGLGAALGASCGSPRQRWPNL